MIEIDLSDYEREAERLGGYIDQVPFAMANALNVASFRTRELFVADTWPLHIHARNRSFLTASLRVETARKSSLTTRIFDQLDRGHLLMHADGGTRRPFGIGRLAIPPKGAVERGPHGVRKDQTPRAIINSTPKRALRITASGIFVAQGGRLHLKYSFKSNANIRPEVPFREDYERYMVQTVREVFPAQLEKAMATRR
jgi:hypothetical protein